MFDLQGHMVTLKVIFEKITRMLFEFRTRRLLISKN